MTTLTPEQANELLTAIFGKQSSTVIYDLQNTSSTTKDPNTCGAKEKLADQVKAALVKDTELNDVYNELNDTQEELAELQQEFEDLSNSIITDEDFLDLEYERLDLDTAVLDAEIKKFALEFVQDRDKTVEANLNSAKIIVDFFREY